MSVRLLFITSHYFMQPTIDALTRLDLPCETKVVPYDNFSHASSVYARYADQFDACFVSGVVAERAIRTEHPNIHKPLIPFQIGPEGLYRDILRFVVESGTVDFSRIAIDFLLPLDMGYSVTDFMKLENIADAYEENANRTVRSGNDGCYAIENLVLDRITELWEQKAIDLVICQYSSNIPALQQRGIPYRCSFLPDHDLNKRIQEVLTGLELQKLRNSHPVIIQIFPRAPLSLSEEQSGSLRRHVQRFLEDNLMDCVIHDNGNCCVVITSLQILRFLTDDFQVCRLSSYLEQKLDFPVLVSYGTGTTVSHAMNHVQLASKETQLTGSPFIVDSRGSLIGPLNSENRMVLSSGTMPDVSEIAKRCSLSTMTIQKLMGIVRSTGSDKITTQELAKHFHTTIRNANRIILNLCRGKVATPVYTQLSHARGRPVQVYALDFGIPLSK